MEEADQEDDHTAEDVHTTAADDLMTEEATIGQTPDDRIQGTEASQEEGATDQEDDRMDEAIAVEKDKAGIILKARRIKRPENATTVGNLVILHVTAGQRKNHVQEHPLAKSKARHILCL